MLLSLCEQSVESCFAFSLHALNRARSSRRRLARRRAFITPSHYSTIMNSYGMIAGPGVRRASRTGHETMHTLVVRPPPLAGLPGSEADGRGRASGSKVSALPPPRLGRRVCGLLGLAGRLSDRPRRPHSSAAPRMPAPSEAASAAMSCTIASTDARPSQYGAASCASKPRASKPASCAWAGLGLGLGCWG